MFPLQDLVLTIWPLPLAVTLAWRCHSPCIGESFEMCSSPMSHFSFSRCHRASGKVALARELPSSVSPPSLVLVGDAVEEIAAASAHTLSGA